MVSSGRLLLLLLLCTVTVSAAPNQKNSPEKVNDFKEVMKLSAKFVQDKAGLIRTAALPLIAFIPVAGPAISVIFVLATVALEMAKKNDQLMKTLKSEFKSLNFKMDEYHIQQTWNSWASGAYHNPEKDIRNAWKTYQTFLSGLPQAKDDKQKENLVKEYVKGYAKYEAATKTLHGYLTVAGTSLTNNLANDLAVHLKCHEKEIREYNVLISQLMYMGSTMNQVYYMLKKTVTPAKIDAEVKMTYESAMAMFQVQKNCIIKSMEYIKKDVEGMMAGIEKKHLPKKVGDMLAQTYDRYDWIVVVFKAKTSKPKFVDKHVLFGFEEVTKDSLTVAVARQVKGTHSKQKAIKIGKAIEKCVGTSTLCYKVVEKLNKCKESVDGVPVTNTYSAVHAFTKKSHEDKNTKETPDEVFAYPEETGKSAFIFTGKCHKSPAVKGGKFIVLIKSDEELKLKNPCKGVNCGGKKRGECVSVKGLFIGMCQCKHPFYGENCKESLDEYKKFLTKRSVEVDKNGEVNLVIDASASKKKPK